MTTVNPNFVETQRAISETLRAHWRLFLFQGVIMIVLGVLAVAAPVLARPSQSISMSAGCS
jgi:uncharacterized membrane protein HdeD (DUF308 family)